MDEINKNLFAMKTIIELWRCSECIARHVTELFTSPADNIALVSRVGIDVRSLPSLGIYHVIL